jgi:peptide chain release factor 1
MLIAKLEKVDKRYRELEQALSDPAVINQAEKFQAYAKEFSGLKELVGKYREYKNTLKEIEDTKTIAEEEGMKELVAVEIDELEEAAEELKKELELLLLPKDPFDEKNIIVEIRGGTGGDEAALFAGDLLRMYLRYAERRGFKTEMIDANATGLGGYKEAIFSIIGKGAYSQLKYESGTHRVQRVPKTEASGRIHTSAATVAVLPEAEEVDIKIDEKDLRIDVFHASGAGGQNVNKVATAIRITHLPTNVVVVCQDERSQHQNRIKAMKLLRSRLLEAAEEKERTKRVEARRIMVGSGDRSEKIRTYNFPQGRVTDHRIGFTTHRLQEVLDGDLDELIAALTTADNTAKLTKLK